MRARLAGTTMLDSISKKYKEIKNQLASCPHSTVGGGAASQWWSTCVTRTALAVCACLPAQDQATSASAWTGEVLTRPHP